MCIGEGGQLCRYVRTISAYAIIYAMICFGLPRSCRSVLQTLPLSSRTSYGESSPSFHLRSRTMLWRYFQMHSILQVRKRELGATSAMSAKNRLEFRHHTDRYVWAHRGRGNPTEPASQFISQTQFDQTLDFKLSDIAISSTRRTFGLQASSEPSLNGQQNDKNKYL